MEIKYLRDGRKVTIISKVNDKDFVVQEIFVTEDGVEKPSGDHFVASNLLEERLLSFAEKKVISTEKRIRDAIKEEATIVKRIEELKKQQACQADLLKASISSIESLKSIDTNHLADVLTGNIKWLCYSSHSGWTKPLLFTESISHSTPINTFRKCYEGLRLLSVFGKSNGNFSYKINRWGDGSGTDSDVVFFKTDDDLHKYLYKTMYDKSEKGILTLEEIINLQKIIEVPESIISAYKEKLKDNYQNRYATSVAQAKCAFDKNMSTLENL